MYKFEKNNLSLNIWKNKSHDHENEEMKYLSWINSHVRCQENAENAFLSVYTPGASGSLAFYPDTRPLRSFALAYHVSHEHTARVKRAPL